ncbi:MAG TPA: tripartite tricarboxylate transporter substrate binding protein [Burkholderiales bacterium]|nr:tripartite tricarboxylate transporter substrate binding protein [Burkholderiales bacterium]
MKYPFRELTLALCALALVAGAADVSAQAWPQKPIRIINPFPPGGGTDVFARPLALKLSAALGQQVIIENMAGAGGTVGAARAAKEPPDGYVWFMGAVHHTIAETLYTRLPYSLERDFAPVTVVAFVPNVVVIHPKHDFKSIQELIAYAKANPGKLNYGSAGNGTTHHLSVELFKTMTGTQLTHVPYKGAGPLIPALLAGEVDLAFDGMGTASTQIKAGKLRPLAVTTAARSPLVPDVPTMQEAGIAGYEVTTWYALWAIRGTPQPIIDRMYTEVVKVMQMPDMKEIWASQGATIGGMPPAEFDKLVKSEIAKWGKVVKDAGIKIDL